MTVTETKNLMTVCAHCGRTVKPLDFLTVDNFIVFKRTGLCQLCQDALN
jgi:hypothetical protein